MKLATVIDAYKMRKYIFIFLMLFLNCFTGIAVAEISNVEFDRAIQKVEKIYSPYIESLGRKLVVIKDWDEFN